MMAEQVFIEQACEGCGRLFSATELLPAEERFCLYCLAPLYGDDDEETTGA